MAEHTPGPWNVLVHPEGETVLNVIAGEPKYVGGRTWATWIAECDADSLDRESAENDANARLIAAAPDLLAACEALLSYLDGPCPDEPPYGAIVQASAAIKKAKGDPPAVTRYPDDDDEDIT